MSFNKADQARRAAEFSAKMIAAGIAPPPAVSIPAPKKPAVLDFQGREIKVGNRIVRAASIGTGKIEIREVTRIENGKVYLDHSKVALNYPDRVVVLK